MSNDSLVYSIRELTELLEKHYEKCPYPDNWIIISDLSGGSMLPAVSGLQKKVFSQII